jgi:hypothetical protein
MLLDRTGERSRTDYVLESAGRGMSTVLVLREEAVRARGTAGV